MRPIERQAFAKRPAEQPRHRHARRLGSDVDAAILDRRDRLGVQPAGREPHAGMQFRRQLREAAQGSRPITRAAIASITCGKPGDHKALGIFRPAGQALIGLDLQEAERPPSAIGMDAGDTGDTHSGPLLSRLQRTGMDDV
jgi:hypothetical protein